MKLALGGLFGGFGLELEGYGYGLGLVFRD